MTEMQKTELKLFTRLMQFIHGVLMGYYYINKKLDANFSSSVTVRPVRKLIYIAIASIVIPNLEKLTHNSS